MASVNKTLGLRFKIEGEDEYKNVIQQLNAGSRTLATEMTRLQAEYKGNTDSLEFLTDKGELLNRMLEQQQKKTEATRKIHEAASEAYAKALQNYVEAEGKSAEVQAEAAEALAAADREMQKYAQALNLAEANEFNLQHSIEENNKAIEDQGKDMVSLGDTVQQLADKFGIKLPDGATKALNGMKGFSAGTVAAMAAAAAAITAVVKVVTDLTKLTLEVASEVDDYITESAVTGVPTEMLQAWDYAAPLIDTDAETIKGAMTKLTKAMGDAKGGSKEAQEQFAAMGVSIVNEADGSLRSAEDVFYDVVDALGSMEEGADRDAAAMGVLGKNAQELNPLINAGSEALQDYAKEAKAAGYVLDESQVKKLGAVDDAYQKLQLTIEGNRKQLAADFAPAAQEAMELFTKVVQKAGEMLERSGIIENLALIIQNLIKVIETIGQIVTNIPIFNAALDTVRKTLGYVAQMAASVADVMDIISTVLTPSSWGQGRIKNALGFGYGSGNANNVQRTRMIQEGTWDQYAEFYGLNATGNDDWRGGLTWVGEAGPELVSLPRGSQIYSNQDSMNMGGTNNYYINVTGIDQLEQVLRWYEGRQVAARMR